MKRIMSKVAKVLSFAHRIPRRRDKHGNPIPRHIASAPPLIQHCPKDLLRRVASVHVEDPELAKRHMPLVWCEGAIKTQENVQAVSDEFLCRMEVANEEHEREIKRLFSALPKLKEREADLEVEYASASAELPIRPKLGEPAFSFADDEPEALEATAARLGISPPGKVPSISKWLTSIAGGCVLAIAFSQVVNAFETSDISDNLAVFASILFVAATLLTIVCALLETLGEWLGGTSQVLVLHHGRRLVQVERALLVVTIICLIMIVVPEVTTERVGIFQAAMEEHGKVPLLPEGDRFWVAFLIVTPTVIWSLVRGLRLGSLKAIDGYLIHARDKFRNEIRQSPAYKASARLHASYRACNRERVQVEAEIGAHRSGIRYAFDQREEQIIEDLDHDCLSASEKAEASLGSSGWSGGESRRRQKRTGFWPFFLRLFGRRVK